MRTPAIPKDEKLRLAALQELGILDTPPEERFDRITATAKLLFEVPIALVSLIDENRQWFKSRQGLDASETPRDISFCGHAILGDSVFVVEDALQDPRFADNPLVTGEPRVRFYAGAPLANPRGLKFGTLCVIDHKPRPFDKRMRLLLRGLGQWAERELNFAEEVSSVAARFESKLRLAAIMENVVDGILTISETGIVESLNPAAVRMFGYAESEVVGHNVSMLMPEPYHSAHDGYLRHYRDTGKRRIIGIGREVVGLRKDGSTFPMELAVGEVALDTGRRFTGIVRDITERKEVEKSKHEFISTVSHELRTPLTSIMGSLGLIAGGAAGAIPPQTQTLIEVAHRNAQRLVRLINDILDIDKIESDKMHFDLRAQQLMPIVRQAIDANRSYAGQLGVEIVLAHALPEAIAEVDGDRLNQVLTNLLSNAAKFSPAGAKVTVAVERRKGSLRISVSDSGPGIPPEFHSRIFQKFSQADASDTRQKGGTGLGLSITKALVERMRGRIGFDSLPGRGAAFFVDLPEPRAPELGERNRRDIGRIEDP